eukprot:GHVS01076329.1.p1 GENE.GHVS01076329.1~~GHVS01076329.1.p1  ORF type:complete len:433 (-),score=138.11 GHVS01076329.1:1461-2735(-)
MESPNSARVPPQAWDHGTTNTDGTSSASGTSSCATSSSYVTSSCDSSSCESSSFDSSSSAASFDVSAVLRRQVAFSASHISALQILAAFRRGRLCLSCDSLAHPMPKCPNGAFVCPNCKGGDHRGHQCKQACRFCGVNHRGISIMDCLKNTSKLLRAQQQNLSQQDEAPTGVRLQRTASMLSSSSSTAPSTCSPAITPPSSTPLSSSSWPPLPSSSSPSAPSFVGLGGLRRSRTLPVDVRPPPPEDFLGGRHGINRQASPSPTASSSPAGSSSLRPSPSSSSSSSSPSASTPSYPPPPPPAPSFSRSNCCYGRTIWLSRLPPSTTDDQITEALNRGTRHGGVVKISRKGDWAYVEMSSLQSAYELVSRKIHMGGNVLKIQFRKSMTAITPPPPPSGEPDGGGDVGGVWKREEVFPSVGNWRLLV